MDKQDRLTIAKSLKVCEALVEKNLLTVGQPFEAEERSKNNEALADALSEFGEHVADVMYMAQTAKDSLEQYFEQQKLQWMKTVDQDGKTHSATKAESIILAQDKAYKEELAKLRNLQKAENVLKRKEKSLYSILDQSRSRLSLVNKDRA